VKIRAKDAKMQPITTASLEAGVYAAASTPMHEDFSCNCEALVNHCNDLLSVGCKGIVLFGTTGEGSSFSVAEREQAIANVIRLGMDAQKIIVGISCCSIEDAVKLASFAMVNHCAAVLIAPPFFYKNVTDEGVINFYKNVIQSVNRPELRILLYHIPQYTGVPITINVIKALKKEFPNTVVGIKESEGNLDFTKEILSTFDGFKVFVGHELLISEAVQLGAAGSISGAANAYPELICSLYEYGKDQGKPNYNPMAKNVIQSLRSYPLFPAIKAIVENQKGREWHVVRPPLVSLNNQQKKELIESLRLSLLK
jgi:4-hydroxy-tetrahydrodipicolinate synthase